MAGGGSRKKPKVSAFGCYMCGDQGWTRGVSLGEREGREVDL